MFLYSKDSPFKQLLEYIANIFNTQKLNFFYVKIQFFWVKKKLYKLKNIYKKIAKK